MLTELCSNNRWRRCYKPHYLRIKEVLLGNGILGNQSLFVCDLEHIIEYQAKLSWLCRLIRNTLIEFLLVKERKQAVSDIYLILFVYQVGLFAVIYKLLD